MQQLKQDVLKKTAFEYFGTSSSSEDASDQSFDEKQSSKRRKLDSADNRTERKKEKKSSKKKKSNRKKKESQRDKIIRLEKEALKRGLLDRGSKIQIGNNRLLESFQGEENQYYFDAKGDNDNLTYESLYYTHVAKYRRLNKTRQRVNTDESCLQGRFWASKNIQRERDRKFKRFNLRNSPKEDGLCFDGMDYVDINQQQETLSEQSSIAGEESVEDYIFRKTGEYNKITRENPTSLQGWIQFLQFQDEAHVLLGRKSSEGSLAEKKLAIIKKALQRIPDDDTLLLSLMDALEVLYDGQQLIDKWQRLLSRRGSPKLWRRFLNVQSRTFNLFTVSQMRETYKKAIAQISNRFIQESEDDLLGVVFMEILFEIQSGYTQSAIRKIQALIEFNFTVSERTFGTGCEENNSNLVRTLFKEFWQSSVPKIGEESCQGFQMWMEQQFAPTPRGWEICEDETTKDQRGDVGQSENWGVFMKLPKIQQHQIRDIQLQEFDTQDRPAQTVCQTQDQDKVSESEESDKSSESSTQGDDDNQEQESLFEDGEIQQVNEEDIEELMTKLGVNFDDELEQMEQTGLDEKIILKWIKEEKQRSFQNSLPQDHTQFQNIQHLVQHKFQNNCVKNYLLSGCFQLLQIPQEQFTNSNKQLSFLLSQENLNGNFLGEGYFFQGDKFSLREFLSCFSPLFNSERSNNNNNNNNIQWSEPFQGWSKFVNIVLNQFCQNSFLSDENLSLQLQVARSFMGIQFLQNFEEKNFEKLRAVCKSTLSKNRENSFLFVAYAEAEIGRLGSWKHGKKIYEGLLQTNKNIQQISFIIFSLCLSALFNTKQKGALEYSFSALIFYAKQRQKQNQNLQKYEQISNEDIVNARREYQNLITEFFENYNNSQNNTNQFDFTHLNLAILFEWLTYKLQKQNNNNDFNGFLNIFTQLMQMTQNLSVNNISAEHEKFVVLGNALFLQEFFHNKKTVPISPQKTRKILQESVNLYPNNKFLLQMMHSLEIKLHALGRYRYNLLQIINEQQNQEIFSFQTQLNYLQLHLKNGEFRHRALQAFQKSIQSKQLIYFPQIWNIYMHFVLQGGGDNKERGKRVFLRGINACPWFNQLWYEGFQECAGVMQGRELGELIKVMRDKEINVYTDIYEILLENYLGDDLIKQK